MAKATTTKPTGRGGKRKGAGRKPGSARSDAPKDVNFNARMDQRTLSLLKKEAAAANLSVSRFAADLIHRGLKKQRDERFEPPARALGFLVSTIASRISEVWLEEVDDKRRYLTWHDDPFMFEAVRAAIFEVMERIRPDGEMVLPSKRFPELAGFDHFFGPLGSPADRAAWAAGSTLRELMSARKEPKNFADGTAAKQAARWQSLEYGFADVREHLGLEDTKLADLVKGRRK